jgi:hypothetical protein
MYTLAEREEELKKSNVRYTWYDPCLSSEPNWTRIYHFEVRPMRLLPMDIWSIISIYLNPMEFDCLSRIDMDPEWITIRKHNPTLSHHFNVVGSYAEPHCSRLELFRILRTVAGKDLYTILFQSQHSQAVVQAIALTSTVVIKKQNRQR